MISLVSVKGTRLLQDFINNVIPEDLPFGALNEECLHFSPAIFETVPTEDNESAKSLYPILGHLANTAGLAAPPNFDAEGNYTAKIRA